MKNIILVLMCLALCNCIDSDDKLRVTAIRKDFENKTQLKPEVSSCLTSDINNLAPAKEVCLGVTKNNVPCEYICFSDGSCIFSLVVIR